MPRLLQIAQHGSHRCCECRIVNSPMLRECSSVVAFLRRDVRSDLMRQPKGGSAAAGSRMLPVMSPKRSNQGPAASLFGPTSQTPGGEKDNGKTDTTESPLSW